MTFKAKYLKILSLLLSSSILTFSSACFAQGEEDNDDPDTSNFADGYSLYERNRDGADFNRFDWPSSSYNLRGQGSSGRYNQRPYRNQYNRSSSYYNQGQYGQHIYSQPWQGYGENDPYDDELPY